MSMAEIIVTAEQAATAEHTAEPATIELGQAVSRSACSHWLMAAMWMVAW